MSRYWIRTRLQPEHKSWRRNLAIHGTGLTMCLSILIVSIVEKFTEGGWLTVVVTSSFIGVAFAIKRHYLLVRDQLRRLDETLLNIPVRQHSRPEGSPPRDEAVAVLLVNGFSGLGVHTLLSVQKLFPKQFRSYLFVSVRVIDSASFKGAAEVDALKRHTVADLEKYVEFARRLGFSADYRYETATSGREGRGACQQIRREYPRSIFFLGSLVSRRTA